MEQRGCSKCRRPLTTERGKMCERCLGWYRESRKKRLASGMCACGEPVVPRTTKCAACRDRERAANRAYLERRKSAGLCTGCGRPTGRNAVTCLGCSAKRVQQGRRKLGVTNEVFAEMSARQGGMCAICLEVPKVLCVDHNHATGCVRQLLCHRCNRVLGLCGEDRLLLAALSEYLTHHAAPESRPHPRP